MAEMKKREREMSVMMKRKRLVTAKAGARECYAFEVSASRRDLDMHSYTEMTETIRGRHEHAVLIWNGGRV
jgi:hypothetical protein